MTALLFICIVSHPKQETTSNLKRRNWLANEIQLLINFTRTVVATGLQVSNKFFYRKHYHRAFYSRWNAVVAFVDIIIEGESHLRWRLVFATRHRRVVFICFRLRWYSNIAALLIIHSDKSIIIGQTVSLRKLSHWYVLCSISLAALFILLGIIFPVLHRDCVSQSNVRTHVQPYTQIDPCTYPLERYLVANSSIGCPKVQRCSSWQWFQNRYDPRILVFPNVIIVYES